LIRVATDVGGTFTDIVAVDEESLQVTVAKADTTPADVVRGVLAAVDTLNVDPGEISLFIHGSTVATNLVVQEKGARTALITTQGFRDVLEVRQLEHRGAPRRRRWLMAQCGHRSPTVKPAGKGSSGSTP
jgi:N-methylhydantoinase A/oxoprolinase/acetone carboxylase beta subunit